MIYALLPALTRISINQGVNRVLARSCLKVHAEYGMVWQKYMEKRYTVKISNSQSIKNI